MEYSCVVDPEFSRTEREPEDEREDTLNEWTNERMGSAGNSSALRFPIHYSRYSSFTSLYDSGKVLYST